MIISNDLFVDLNTYIEIYEILNKYIKILEKTSIFTTFDFTRNLYNEFLIRDNLIEGFRNEAIDNKLKYTYRLKTSLHLKLSDEYLPKDNIIYT